MLLVIDANVVFTSLIARGGTFRVFVANKILRKFRFVAPEHLFIEIREHFDEILEKTKLSQEELEVVLNFLEEQIEVIPFEEFEDRYEEAKIFLQTPTMFLPHTCIKIELCNKAVEDLLKGKNLENFKENLRRRYLNAE